MILSRAWLHDTVSCAAWNDARKVVYLKPLFKTPCSNCYWGWSKPIMLDYRDISLMESVPLLWRTVTASPVGIEPMTILAGEGPSYNWYLIHNVENSTFSTGWPPQYPLWLCWSTENSGSWRYLSWLLSIASGQMCHICWIPSVPRNVCRIHLEFHLQDLGQGLQSWGIPQGCCWLETKQLTGNSLPTGQAKRTETETQLEKPFVLLVYDLHLTEAKLQSHSISSSRWPLASPWSPHIVTWNHWTLAISNKTNPGKDQNFDRLGIRKFPVPPNPTLKAKTQAGTNNKIT